MAFLKSSVLMTMFTENTATVRHVGSARFKATAETASDHVTCASHNTASAVIRTYSSTQSTSTHAFLASSY